MTPRFMPVGRRVTRSPIINFDETAWRPRPYRPATMTENTGRSSATRFVVGCAALIGAALLVVGLGTMNAGAALTILGVLIILAILGVVVLIARAAIRGTVRVAADERRRDVR